MFQHPLVHQELAGQRAAELQRGGRGRPGERHAAKADAFAGHELTAIVERARIGDAQAWEALVTRFTPALRSVARSYRLNASDVEDAVQTAWASAFRCIDSIREPEALGGWLMVTVRREAIRTLRGRQREIPVPEIPEADATEEAAPVNGLLETERRTAIRAAVDLLPERQRVLLHALISKPEATYDELSRRLTMPLGSIGPTRQRALALLRRNHDLKSLASPDAGSAA